MAGENQVQHVAIHDIRRQGGAFTIEQGTPNHPITETIQRVVDELYELYAKRASKSHGRFEPDEVNYPTQKHLRTYIESGFREFEAFGIALMNTLKAQADLKPTATGGHVFITHFTRNDQHFILVCILNDKLSAALLNNSVEDVHHLDIDGYRFAGRISISGWINGDERYISFLKGKGDVADYFERFLGCASTSLAAADTRALVEVIRKYASDQGMADAEKDEFLRRAKDICERYSKARTPIDFTTFANELNPENPEAITRILGDPDRGISDGFVPDRRSLASLVKYKASTKRWKIEFEREALTEGAIEYNQENKTLTLKHLPDELVSRLTTEFEEDNA